MLTQIENASTTKRYKPSRFNAHTEDTDGSLLLYNRYTGHYCTIPPRRAFDARRHLSAVGCGPELDNLGKYLLRKGYIVSASADEGARWDIRYGAEQYRQDRLELTLLASENCNFRCTYCSQEFKRGAMQADIRRGVLNHVSARIQHLRSLDVSWFGGEPLLGYDAIREVAPSLHDEAKRREIHFTSSMTTNGYLLFPDRARELVDWGITSYQITLDGGQSSHDSHRPLSTGGSTFSQILDNLIAMSRLKVPFTVLIRLNFDQSNLAEGNSLFDSLKRALGQDNRFKLGFYPVGRWGGPNDANLMVCGMKESQRGLIQLTAEATTKGLATESLLDKLLPAPGSGVCYAARPYSLIVGADGKLMKCTVVLDTMADNVVGQLHEDGSITLLEDRFAQWIKPYYQGDTTCKKCFFLPSCQGASCPLPRIESGSRPCPNPKLFIRQTLKDVRGGV